MQDTKLSSKFTNLGLYGGLILTPFICFMSIQSFSNRNSFDPLILIPLAILIAITAFTIYQFKYVAHAKIQNNTLVFKKQFSSEQTYPFDKIEKISSFRLKNTQYTTVILKNRHNTLDKYIIINSKSFLFPDKVDAKEILRQIKREHRK